MGLKYFYLFTTMYLLYVKENPSLLSVDVFHDRILNDVFIPVWFKVIDYIICYLISLSLFQLSELKEVQAAANS